MAATKKTATRKKPASEPRARVPGSMSERIDSLKVGESVAEAKRFEMGDVGQAELLDTLKKMRGNLAAYVARITDELDAREFKVEGGVYLTDDKSALIVACTVSRV